MSATKHEYEWDDVILNLDLEKVGAEIDNVDGGKMPNFERQDVRELVLIAAKRWLPGDLEEIEILGVEEEFETPTMRGIVDLRGRHRGKVKQFTSYSGDHVIIDWKTTKGALDADWANRYKYSWQWGLYADLDHLAKLFSYRGISRTGEMREVIIEIPEGKREEAQRYLAQVRMMRRTLSSKGPWPRKMPSSCRAYGRECEFFDSVCSKNIVIPDEVDINKKMSYSGSETFLLCPEKHRLTQIAGYGDDDEVLAFGKAFHRGIAEIYRQAYQLNQKDTDATQT
jgi:hypothetical protein